jgi:hypothetical protein
MKYKVVLQRSEEGVSASVPGLPGCWSQGQTEGEAGRHGGPSVGPSTKSSCWRGETARRGRGEIGGLLVSGESTPMIRAQG